MSRIGKKPINIPAKVEVGIDGQQVTIKGPKGSLSRTLPSEVEVLVEEQQIMVKRRNETRKARQLHGLCRTLVANMVEGVSAGFQRRLEIQGVGYRAQQQDSNIVLSMGYSHPVIITPPEGIQLKVENNTNIIISGIDKESVGNLTAKIRAVRPPEIYKGKGIRYAGETFKLKQGKTGKK